ncbi:MAG: Hsp70 family protein [Hyphomicrobiaceae bacterium]
MSLACGIDFGTSNSSVALDDGTGARLLPLQDGATAVPTALFFSFDDDTTTFGREAMQRYLMREPGRLLRAIKTLLGTALYEEMTQVRSRRYAFSEILTAFLAFLRQSTASGGEAASRVVLGRPAFFVDNNPEADRTAQSQLEAAARAAGFRDIAFQFEPIAAALHYEAGVATEELALVADIGGGTSDFSLVRVGPELRRKADRRGDILGWNGVRVGGTDFDRNLSLATLMPFLGKGSALTSKGLETPSWWYADLATWHRINVLYEGKVITGMRGVLRESAAPERIERLIRVVEDRKGHALLARIEEAKIALSGAEATRVELSDVTQGLALDVEREQLETAIADGLGRIEGRVRALLADAGVAGGAVSTVFLTGGSSGMPAVREAILRPLPAAHVIAGDAFGSVAIGLAIDAARRFGPAS